MTNLDNPTGMFGIWKPGDQLAMLLDDQTAEPRTEAEQEALIEAIRELVGRHGFKLRTWGGGASVFRFMLKTYSEGTDSTEQRLRDLEDLAVGGGGPITTPAAGQASDRIRQRVKARR